MRKRQRDTETPKDDPMLTSPIAKSIPQCPASPTSSLELIASIDGGSEPQVGLVNGPGRASPTRFYLAHGSKGLGLTGC